MHLQQRINLLVELGKYMSSDDVMWRAAKEKASKENSWFTLEFIDIAVKNITDQFLTEDKLKAWAKKYILPEENRFPKNIGLVMAGNIPLVGFHDFLCIFISGNKQTIKPSSKDTVLIRHIAEKLFSFDNSLREYISFSEMLKGCDAYIATGSNNSARYFEYYFSKYPNIIRRNRTSVAVLNGDEPITTLEKLADDVYLYFGLGCRNVTKIYVPENYDFILLLEAFGKYNHLADNHKYKNNYDYQLALLILNRKYYMSNESLLLTENSSYFSPISVLHYEYYKDTENVLEELKHSEEIQCVSGLQFPVGNAQQPGLEDYADGIDTMNFLRGL